MTPPLSFDQHTLTTVTYCFVLSTRERERVLAGITERRASTSQLHSFTHSHTYSPAIYPTELKFPNPPSPSTSSSPSPHHIWRFVALSLLCRCILMRSTSTNLLDLNNYPIDHSKDGKQVLVDDTASSGQRKKRSGKKDGVEGNGKIYECRFCSLKFCKSQALGGHMNRHRQERESETLHRARQIVNENLAAQGAPQLGNVSNPITPGGGCLHRMDYRPIYPGTTSMFSPQYHQPFLPPCLVPPEDYYHQNQLGMGMGCSNYSCIGSPVIGPVLQVRGAGTGVGIGSSRASEEDGERACWGNVRSTQGGSGF